MDLKVKITVEKVIITIDLDDVYLNKHIISELNNQGVCVNLRTDTVYLKDSAKILDTSDFLNAEEALSVLTRKGRIELRYEEINANYRNKPVEYKIGGFN